MKQTARLRAPSLILFSLGVPAHTTMLKYLSVALLLFTPCIAAKGVEPVTGKITGFGIVRVPAEHKDVPASSPPGNVSREFLGDPVLVRSTTRIPAKIGTWFGIFYHVRVPAGAGEIQLSHVTKSPELHLPGGGVKRSEERKATIGIKGSKTANAFASFMGFGFTERYELVPGTWTLEVRFKGSVVCRQQFEVTRD
jgi:hypothetical protein